MKASDDILALEIRVAKAGYGSLREVQKFTAREMLQCLAYEKFLCDHESASYYLAQKGTPT